MRQGARGRATRAEAVPEYVPIEPARLPRNAHAEAVPGYVPIEPARGRATRMRRPSGRLAR